MAEPQEQYRYWAFISYSNKDALVARRLHRRLENYRIPRDLRGRPGLDGPVPSKLFPIFRDREELPLSSDLGASIEDALRAARYLIVLCSPAAAQSRWVNEEVRYFKSLGREQRIFAIILSGEPNDSDVATTAERECFPPALRHRLDTGGNIGEQRTEPIGGDLRPGGDGWHRVFLKCVAGITGMGFDAFARRERKRRMRQQIAAAAAGIALLAAAGWAYDYNRLKVSYYETFVTRWGVPVGVVPVDPRQPAGREFYYRFEVRRERLRRLLFVDRRGNPHGEEFNNNVAIREIHYREDGSIRELVQFQRNNKLIRRAVYSNPRPLPGGGAIQYIDFHQENQDAPLSLANDAVADVGNPFGSASRSEITGQQVTYDSLGRTASITNLNAYHQKRANSAGAFGVRYDYRGSALVASATENLGFDGKPAPSRIAVLRSEYARDLAHNSYEWRYFGANQRPVLERGGYHLYRHVFDSRADRTEDSYFGADGKPVLLADGYHKFVATFDQKGLHTEWTYFGVDGKPVFNKAGYHRVALTYDTDGNLVDFAYFGVDGEPVYSNAGFHRQRASYDRRGNQLETTCFGVDDQPTLNKQGYFRATQAVDGRGNITDIAYYGTHGEAVVGNFGTQAYHRIKQAFDDGDNMVDVRYFDISDRPYPPVADTFNHVHREFDERGNLVGGSLYNGDTPISSYIFGFHSFTSTYDQRGNPTEWALFAVDGKPVVSPKLGIHSLKQKFDERGRATEESSWGLNGAVQNLERYHRLLRVFDERSNVREVFFFGTHGEPAFNTAGCHHAISEYDDVGRAIAAECFGAHDEPIKDNDGYHRVVHTYDTRGNQTSEAYFGVQGQPINGLSGYHRVLRTFNDRGDYFQEAYFGPNDQPMAIAAGYHRLQRVLNDRGWEVGLEYFGTHGEPALNADGIHRVAKSYDARGREASEAYFGPHGEPTLNRKGYQRAALEYFGDYPKISKITYFDASGKETIGPDSRIANSLFAKFVVMPLPDGSLVLGIPTVLPKGDIVVYVEPSHLSFVGDHRILADIPPQNAVVVGDALTADKAFSRLMTLAKVPVVEFVPGGAIPTEITRTLDIRRGPPPGLH